MAKVKVPSSEPMPKFRPAINPEARDNQVISMAYDLAEKRLREGTATSQEVTHFLKLGSAKAPDELELLKAQTAMTVAKKEALESQKNMEEVYAKAIKAMRTYHGMGDPDDEDY